MALKLIIFELLTKLRVLGSKCWRLYMESRKLIKENKETLILYDLKTEKITPEAR